jgi:hypothetical protein
LIEVRDCFGSYIRGKRDATIVRGGMGFVLLREGFPTFTSDEGGMTQRGRL